MKKTYVVKAVCVGDFNSDGTVYYIDRALTYGDPIGNCVDKKQAQMRVKEYAAEFERVIDCEIHVTVNEPSPSKRKSKGPTGWNP